MCLIKLAYIFCDLAIASDFIRWRSLLLLAIVPENKTALTYLRELKEKENLISNGRVPVRLRRGKRQLARSSVHGEGLTLLLLRKS
jgi:hypothetical protein